MAYKDEYEVARLYTNGEFAAKIAAQFEGDFKVHYYLAPPILARFNSKGELQKQEMGSWMQLTFKALAALKGLRGSAFDIFGYTQERRQERNLVKQYQNTLKDVLPLLTPQNQTLIKEWANIPEQIKGFGHVKERNLKAAMQRWDSLLQQIKV